MASRTSEPFKKKKKSDNIFIWFQPTTRPPKIQPCPSTKSTDIVLGMDSALNSINNFFREKASTIFKSLEITN